MAFRMNLKGRKINDDLFHKLVQARDMRTHGAVASVEALESGKFAVTMSDGTVRTLGEVRLYNLIHADLVAEPARRKVWKATHPVEKRAKDAEKAEIPQTPAVTPRSERFKREDQSVRI